MLSTLENCLSVSSHFGAVRVLRNIPCSSRRHRLNIHPNGIYKDHRCVYIAGADHASDGVISIRFQAYLQNKITVLHLP